MIGVQGMAIEYMRQNLQAALDREGLPWVAVAASDDIEDVPGDGEPDDIDEQPADLAPDPNDGPVPLQAGEDS